MSPYEKATDKQENVFNGVRYHLLKSLEIKVLFGKKKKKSQNANVLGKIKKVKPFLLSKAFSVFQPRLQCCPHTQGLPGCPAAPQTSPLLWPLLSKDLGIVAAAAVRETPHCNLTGTDLA